MPVIIFILTIVNNYGGVLLMKVFDISKYKEMNPKDVRQAIRDGEITFPTAGMCQGYAQANLVILPPECAEDLSLIHI